LYSNISFNVCAISAGILTYISKHKKREIILVTIAAHQIAFFIKDYIDCIPDPTNHNLVPFEILVHLIFDVVLCLLAVLLAAGLKLITIKK
jgi:hypothetical protein